MLHPTEIERFHELQSQGEAKAIQFLASRWALKEAVIKATGSRLLFPEMYLQRNSEGMGTFFDLPANKPT